MFFHVLLLGLKTYHLCTNSRLTYLAIGFIYTLHIYTLSLECSLTIAVAISTTFAGAGAHQISLYTLASPPVCSFTSTVDKFIAGVFCLFKSRPIRWPATCLTLPSPVCRARKCGLAQEGLAPNMSSLKYCSSDVLLKRCFSWRYAVKFPWFLAE